MVDEILKRSIEAMINEFRRKHKGKNSFIIEGKENGNDEVIEACKKIEGVEEVKEKQFKNRSGKDVEVVLEQPDVLSVSFDGGDTWEKF